jgi:hypothetical protein
MEVLKYIIKNPNQTENKIVIAFKGSYARLSVRKTIQYLSENKIIKVKKINSNQHEIIPDSKNLLTNLIQNLDNFEEKTIILVNQLEKVINQRQIVVDQDTIKTLYYVYQHQVLMYLLHALFVWPSTIKDDELLSSMYLTLFPKLRNILNKIEIKISISNSKIAMRRSLIDSFFGLTPYVLNEILVKSKKYDINPEIEKVLDVIWNNSKIFYHDISHNFENEPHQKIGYKTDKKIPDNWRDVID